MLKNGEISPPLQKSKSMCCIYDLNKDVAIYIRKQSNVGYRRQSVNSESSVEVATADSESDEAGAGASPPERSTLEGHAIHMLEQKIDRLNDMFLEQCRLLTTLKEDIRNSKAAMEKVDLNQTDFLADIVKKTVFESGFRSARVQEGVTETNSRARILLDAIEARHWNPVDREIRDALARFLESDELKDNMVAVTAESVRGVIGDCISRDLSSLYLPMLEHSHRRLVRQVSKTVEDGFKELEQNSVNLSRSVHRITRSLRRSIERHQNLLDAASDPNKNLMNSLKCTVEELLHDELKQWRQKVLDVLTSEQPEPVEETLELQPESIPSSPLQPPNMDESIIDQLMKASEISNLIAAGEVNAAFERALCAANLSLVTAACRSGERAGVFSPCCKLHQHVLLALLQQLSTDMLHETHLKCRYLEDSIINLDPNNELTREHLPLVVGEVRMHLTKFLTSYPNHVANRRVALIIMAANNLLK